MPFRRFWKLLILLLVASSAAHFAMVGNAAMAALCIGAKDECNSATPSTCAGEECQAPVPNDAPELRKSPDVFPVERMAPSEPEPGSDSQITVIPNKQSWNQEKRLAIVIGNAAYQNTVQLRNTKNDAVAIGELFSEIGFEVRVGLDLDYRSMRKFLQQSVSKQGNLDLLVFYYAGHGMQINGRNYMIPTDAEIADETAVDFETISTDFLFRMFSSISETSIIFLDACRDNPLARSTRTRSIGNVRGLSGLAAIESSAGSMINFATSPGNVALDGDGEHSPFAAALLEHIATPGVSVETVMQRVRTQVYLETDGMQRPWTNTSLMREILLVPVSEGALADLEISLDDELKSHMFSVRGGKINGQHVRWLGEDATFIDEVWDHFVDGVNFVEASGRRMRVWAESGSIRQFDKAYSESHAVIIAIDDYPRKSGFQSLDLMERKADQVKKSLENLGFPSQNITTLYGGDATKENIEKALEKYWGRYSEDDRSRLVVYYGGHGSHVSRRNLNDSDDFIKDGILIPFDHDPEFPYRSSIILEDIRDRYLKRSRVHHTLILIDACSSGLVLPTYADGPSGENRNALRTPGNWRKIQMSLKNPHQAIIVAGTGDERALWVNGGVFTKTLIQSLEGKADMNGDGLIMYDELYYRLHEGVLNLTFDEGVEQSPAEFDNGSGRIFFELPAK